MSRKLTTAEFTHRAREKHGDRYDYTEVHYTNDSTEVVIICPEHGPFRQIAGSHLQGYGCRACGQKKSIKARRKGRAQFIAEARAIHGDRYGYDEVEYKNSATKIDVRCNRHGIFRQSPAKHLSGQGCPKCANEATGNRCRLTIEEFLTKAEERHGNRYGYEKVQYEDSHSNICIICPEHGPFEQTPTRHLSGGGCHACAVRRSASAKQRDTRQFIEHAKKKHGERYGYDKVHYLASVSKVTIVCPEHGPFIQEPASHLQGHGCPDCAGVKLKTRDQFIKEARKVHGSLYGYEDVVYKNALVKVTIHCPEHGPFAQLPGNHLKGVGCPSCATSGFDESDPAILYYLKVSTRNQEAWKIGITNRSVEERFRPADLDKISILDLAYFEIGMKARIAENVLLRRFESDSYDGDPILEAGNTELFRRDVLGPGGLNSVLSESEQ